MIRDRLRGYLCVSRLLLRHVRSVYCLVLTNSNRYTWSGYLANELKAVSRSERSRRSTDINRIN